jgi:uncharacterized membrane protein YozB (DUF420 family)
LFLVNRGFLRTGASFGSDLTLLIEIGMGLALLAGMLLARRRRYRTHAWCQSTVVLLNLVAIALTMAPSFRRSFAPAIPAVFSDSYYALAAVHAALGTVAEVLGLYILAVAGTGILPQRLRFTRYKPWMRTALALWWLVLLLGIGTYARWYIVPLLAK